MQILDPKSEKCNFDNNDYLEKYIQKNADFPKFCEYGSIFNEKTKNEEGLEAENLDFKADVL